ncbi:hypothetical protein SADUNF_Sadunf11G0004400 [Salix dunnii]|uniref:Glycine-rich protein n=1 Tax=Salix dunnii TaxID=1413687 RepID=A0A835JKT0_9ROSI|nr:hypothetical protein SADUNF_Sadunf11G0004400 [Salix dunnii]
MATRLVLLLLFALVFVIDARKLAMSKEGSALHGEKTFNSNYFPGVDSSFAFGHGAGSGGGYGKGKNGGSSYKWILPSMHAAIIPSREFPWRKVQIGP